MVTGFNHSGFVVRDLENMVQFYCGELGLKVVREVDSVAPPEGNHTGIPGAHRKLVFVGMPDGGHVLELVHYMDPPSPEVRRADRNELGAAHICFNVTDLEGLHRRLTSRGIQFVTPPIWRTTPEGGRSGICYCRDPEGNFVELIQPAQ